MCAEGEIASPLRAGADLSGLGERGAAEVPEDRIGHRDDTNISAEETTPK